MNINDIITLSLLIALLLIAISFVLYKRKLLLMLRALFSTRHLQQLLREGRSTNEYTHAYSILLYLFVFPCLALTFFHFYLPNLLEISSLLKLYGLVSGGVVVCFLVSHFFLWYFTAIFNYQEQRHLYLIIKTIYRFYHALLLACIVPIVWYACAPKLLFFIFILPNS